MNCNAIIIERFQGKYEYFSEDEVDSIYEQALNDYLMLKYPNDNLTKLPEKDNYAIMWIYSRMNEIVELEGVSSYTAYRENGVSMSFDNSYISDGLRAMIKPKVGKL